MYRPMPFTDRLCLVQQLDYHTPLSEIIMILIVTIGFGNSADKLRMPRSPAYSAAAADSLHAELVCTITSDLCSAICSGSEAVTTRVRGGILRYVFCSWVDMDIVAGVTWHLTYSDGCSCHSLVFVRTVGVSEAE